MSEINFRIWFIYRQKRVHLAMKQTPLAATQTCSYNLTVAATTPTLVAATTPTTLVATTTATKTAATTVQQ